MPSIFYAAGCWGWNMWLPMFWLGSARLPLPTRLNRRFVFQSRTRGASAVFREAVRFYLARVATLLMESGLLVLAVEGFRLSDTLPEIGAGVLVILVDLHPQQMAGLSQKSLSRRRGAAMEEEG